MNILIDGKLINSELDFYNVLLSQLGPDVCMGKNLHALWDVMGFGIERPIQFSWINAGVSKEKLGAGYYEITNVLKRVEANDVKHCLPEKFILDIVS